MKPTIAIVGASARSSAASAVRAGFQPITADLFADVDLREIATTTRISPYPEGFLDWLRMMGPPAWMYTGALENHAELVDQMAWIAPLWGNPGDVLQRVRSPLELARVLRDAGLLFPETRESADGLPRNGSWLAKTYHGASGSGVRAFETERGRGGEGEWENDDKTTVFHQRRISGVPCACVFAATEDSVVLLGVTRQIIGESWLGAHGYQYAGSIGLLPIDDEVRATITRIGQVVTQEFELSGLFGIDFVLDGGDVWTIEVNPRYTASVEICERATGAHALALHARAYGGETQKYGQAGRSFALHRGEDAPALSRPNQPVHGKAILFAKRSVVLSELFSEMTLAEAQKRPWPTLADISPAGTPIEAGRPVLTVFAEGATVEEVDRNLRNRVSELEQQLYGSEAAP